MSEASELSKSSQPYSAAFMKWVLKKDPDLDSEKGSTTGLAVAGSSNDDKEKRPRVHGSRGPKEARPRIIVRHVGRVLLKEVVFIATQLFEFNVC